MKCVIWWKRVLRLMWCSTQILEYPTPSPVGLTGGCEKLIPPILSDHGGCLKSCQLQWISMKNNFHSWKNETSPSSIILMPTVHLCKGGAFDSQKLDCKWSTFILHFQAILTERLDDLQYEMEMTDRLSWAGIQARSCCDGVWNNKATATQKWCLPFSWVISHTFWSCEKRSTRFLSQDQKSFRAIFWRPATHESIS